VSRAFTRGSGLTRTLACAAAVLLTWASATVAGEVRFTASVDQTTVGLGEQFQLVLSVEGEDMLSAPSPVLPALAAFEVLGRSSSQSTNISLIGGQLKKQATVSFIYVLAARQLGTAVIPAATLKYEGKEYQSQPIEMTVVKAAQGQATPMPGGANAPQAPSRIPLEGNLFLSVTPSRRTAYVGEPITVDILLCSRFQVESGGWAELPTFDGFWAEKVFEASRFDFERRTIEGRAFGVAELKKVMLFPLTAGDVTIKPMAFNVSVAQAPRDFFDMLGSSQTVRVDSKPLALKILPLPEKDRPAEFTGGVGQFTLEAALDRTSTTNGEPVNLTVRVSGSGNVRMIDPPTIASNPGLKILSAETKDDVHVTVDGARGTKTFRFPIIPQSDGRFELPPIAMAYFDPQARAYRRLASGPLAFTATGSATIAPVTEASGLKVLGNDIAYIKPDATGLSSMPMDAPWWPNAMALASLGVAGLALGYRGHRERLESDRGYARKTRSTALVRRRLHQAEQLLKKRDERGFHAELSRAVLGYLGDRFNLDTHALTRDQLRTGLAERAVAPETIDAVLGIVDRCEVARFSPDDAGGRDPRALFDSVRDVLARV
jgi:hypothetical protein